MRRKRIALCLKCQMRKLTHCTTRRKVLNPDWMPTISMPLEPPPSDLAGSTTRYVKTSVRFTIGFIYNIVDI